MCDLDRHSAKLQGGSCYFEVCTEEEIHILHQRAADFGFPVRHLKEAIDGKILKIVLAACALAS